MSEAERTQPVAIHGIDFESLPVAALRVEGDRVTEVNAAYAALMHVNPADIVGRSLESLIGQFVATEDTSMASRAAAQLVEGASIHGDLWCRVNDGSGHARTLRVVWRPAENARDAAQFYVFHLDVEGDARERELAEVLALVGAELLRCRNEEAVLQRATEALAARGLSVTVLLLREGDPLLAYGPSRGPKPSPVSPAYLEARPPREVLTRFNPKFHERRAMFFQHGERLVRDSYPSEIAPRVEALMPSRRMVQAPLFVDDKAYGAMVVTDDRLTPVTAGTLEIFAQLVGAAVENARLHQKAAERLNTLQKLQDELLERERLAALGEAAAVMAHEVRNPIGAILNAVTLLERGKKAGASQAELHRVIAEEAERLERLVSDLLAVGRPLVPRVREANLADVAEATITMLRTRHELAHSTVDPVVIDGRVMAAIDPDLVELAVLNVVRNALQASPPHGHVRITVGSRDDEVVLTVDDDGPGIDEEVARRMFEPFFTTRATGTGIGLAVVRRVVDASGGRVEIGRSSSGGGRISLVFPAFQAEA